MEMVSVHSHMVVSWRPLLYDSPVSFGVSGSLFALLLGHGCVPSHSHLSEVKSSDGRKHGTGLVPCPYLCVPSPCLVAFVPACGLGLYSSMRLFT